MSDATTFTGLVSAQAVLAAARRPVLRLLVRRDATTRGLSRLIVAAQSAGAPVERLPDAAFRERFGRDVEECALECGPRCDVTVSELADRLLNVPDAWLVALEGIEDPHDLGAVLRTAVAAGSSAALLVRRLADVSPDVVARSSAGTSETMTIAVADDMADALTDLAAAGFRVLAAAPDAERTLYQTDLTGRLVWVLGGERRGISRRTLAAADERVSLPMSTGVQSLTVVACAGALFYETRRRRA